MPSILIAEQMVDAEITRIANEEKNIDIHYQPDLEGDALAGMMAQHDVLIIRPKPITGEMIAEGAAGKLKLIIRGGAGVNSIDLDAAQKHDVAVENTPGLNSTATAECTMALIQALAGRRRLMPANFDVWGGKPNPPEHYMGNELEGKTIAIAGFGNIGKRVARIAAQGYQMNVLAWSPSLTPAQAAEIGAESVENFQDLLDAQPDILSLHIPYNDTTHHVMNDAAFATLKLGTILINTARPFLIDPEALGRALDCNIIARYAIDADADQLDPFLAIDTEKKGILLPHIGDATIEAHIAITRQALDQAFLYLRENKYQNRV